MCELCRARWEPAPSEQSAGSMRNKPVLARAHQESHKTMSDGSSNDGPQCFAITEANNQRQAANNGQQSHSVLNCSLATYTTKPQMQQRCCASEQVGQSGDKKQS